MKLFIICFNGDSGLPDVNWVIAESECEARDTFIKQMKEQDLYDNVDEIVSVYEAHCAYDVDGNDYEIIVDRSK